ncbi:MAG: hypothetical protein JNK15_20850 [Planctomycetes bacterium]|nr:hypothetical protein [Planctomycetota bacterium]
MIPVRVAGALFAAAVGAQSHAQAPALAPFVPVDTAPTLAVAMVWQHGLDDDGATQPGLCRVLLQCRLRRVRAAVPELLASGGDVDASTSLLWAVCDRSAAEAALRFLQVAADDSAAIAADEFAMARARASLVADDEAFVLPGPMLQASAGREWFPGAPLATRGDGREPAAILGYSLADVQAALLRERPRRVGALGACAATFVRAATAFERGDLPGPWPSARVSAGPPVATAEPPREHARLDGPVVAWLRPVDGVERAPLAVAVQIARARADRRWKPRAAEGAARLPFVGWDWLRDEPFVAVHRRGFDQRRLLPGERAADVAAEVAATRAEIEALLADLRQAPVRADELAAAVAALARTFGHEGAAVAAGEPRAAAVWLAARMRAVVRGIEPAGIQAVTAAAAEATLRTAVASGAGSWHVLIPRSREGYGFDRR